VRRRRFVTSGAALLWCAVSRPTAAQKSKPYRIAYLTGYSAAIDTPLLDAFKRGLAELGYKDGRDVVIDARHADGQPERLAQLASELAAQRPDIFVVGSGAAALVALNKVAGSTAVVMANVQDPLSTGLVESLARPGGNITGLSDFHAASVTKRLELVKEAVPGLKTVGVLWNADSKTNAEQLRDLERSAPALKLAIVSLPVKTPADIQPRLADLRRAPGTALLLLGDFVLTTNMAPIAKYAMDHRLPAVYTTRPWAEAGGFMAYGTSFEDLYRRAAVYVDKILKGAKPGELPIEQPTKFDLVINLRTAKAIGVTVPRAVLLRADYVIE
jgi:putative ABC transport system substrate-binding protein